MNNIREEMEARKNYLLGLQATSRAALEGAPQGTLRICGENERAQYYHRMNAEDSDGKYIGRNNRALAMQLAQKRYNEKVLISVQKELRAIEKYMIIMPETCAEDIYEKLHEARKKLIVPIRETDEQYIEEWQNRPYTGKLFEEGTPEIYTERGERVRSKSEVIIADLLNKEGIPYRYECPLKIAGRGMFYPDFTVLNVKRRKEIYWEHLGLMDEPSYVEKALHKISIFEENGIMPKDNLILTFETKNIPLNRKVIKGMIDKYIL